MRIHRSVVTLGTGSALAAACWSVAAAAVVAAPSGPAATEPTKAEVASLLSATQLEHPGFSVAYSMRVTAGREDALDEHETLASDGSRWHCAATAVPRGAGMDQASHSLSVTSDGQSTVVFDSRRGSAFIAAAGDAVPFTGMGSAGFYYSVFSMRPVLGSHTDAYPRRLHALLASDRSELLPGTEKVGDCDCRVLEVRAEDGSIDGKVWLDPARGYLPLRQLWRDGGSDRFLTEVLVTESVKAAENWWMPTRGVRTSLGGALVQEMAVDRDPVSGELAFAAGVAGVTLDPLWGNLPAGTAVLDSIRNSEFVVSAADAAGRARALPGSVHKAVGAVDAQPAAQPTGWLAKSLIGLSAALACGVVAAVAVGARDPHRNPKG